MKTRLRIGLLVASIIFGAVPVALAQGTTGRLIGTVKDAEGNVLPGATVSSWAIRRSASAPCTG